MISVSIMYFMPMIFALCAIALQELIDLCCEYSVDIDLNFNATKSYCVAYTPKLYKLALPSLHINHLPNSYRLYKVSWIYI